MRAGVKVGVAVAVAAGLTACGGGGGGAGGGGGYGAPPVTGNLPRAGSGGSGVRSGAPDYGAELGRNWGLATIGANPDAAGQIGTGVTVGIVDTGIDLTHPDFTGAISPDSVDIITGTYANVADQGGHGTSVAGVIGARRDGYDGVGVAPGSTLLAVRADSPGSCLAGSCTFYHSDLALATDYAVAHGARILNYSLGGSGMDQSFIDALNNAFSHHTVVVAAAGNAQGADPIDPAKWAAVNGNGLGLAVGAIDSSGALAWFSNQAGVAKDHFLVAPGQNITTTANGGGTHTVSGTSFASPHVAGAAAVVWGASPFLTGEQVVSILLNSATDLGAPGVDDVYGHGLLNLPAALQPQGTLSIPTGATVAQGGAALSATSLSLGGAFGDAMSRATPLSRATVFDAYGRPYRADLSGAVQAPAPQRDLSGWLAASGETATMAMGETASMTLSTPPEPMHEGPRQRPGDDRAPPRFALSAEVGGNSLSMARGFGLDNFTGLAASAPATALEFPTGSPLATPFLGLAGDGNSVTAGRALGDGVGIRFGFSHDDGTATLPGDADRPARQAWLGEATKRWQDGTVVGFQVGRLGEDAGPLGSSGNGAFDLGGGADTTFTGLFAATPLSPSTTAFASASYGMTSGQGLGGGLLRDFSDVGSRAYGVGLATTGAVQDGDRLGLAVSRPLKVVAGSASLDVPVGRSMDGTVLTESQRVALSPSGTETDFEVTWSMPLEGPQSLVVGGMMMLEPGNVADADIGYGAGLKYRLRW